MVPLSVLDLSPVATGALPSDALRDSVAVAQACDALGYARFWLAEHHNMANVAASAPEVLIAHIAAVTSRIRVGAGGIMLPNHNPLRVVEIFRTLEALHPGRIDLGLGRAPGTDPVTAAALQRDPVKDPNQRLLELFAFDQGTFPESHPFHQIRPMPTDVRLPATWMLGSSLGGAELAASFGLRYAFAGHFAMRNAHAALGFYRKHFSPSSSLARSYAMLAVTVICGEDDAHAEQLAAPVRLSVVRIRTGRRAPIPTLEEALAYAYSPDEQAIVDEFLRGAIIGGPERVRAGLERLADESGADEIILSSLIPYRRERIAHYERVARVAGLSGAA